MTTTAPERDLAKENAELQKQVKAQEQTIEELKPTKNVAQFLFNTAEDVVAFYGDKQLDQMVKDTQAQENKKRVKQGYDRLSYTPEEFAEAKDALVADLLADRTKWGPPLEGFLDRTIKMIKPDGALIQIPFEGQINNVAGSLNDGLFKYEKKGYKRTDPMLCPTKDCYEESASEKGKWLWTGYCSEDHYRRTEWQRQSTAAV